MHTLQLKLTGLIGLAFVLLLTCNQKNTEVENTQENLLPHYRIMFYNVENLFDIIDDPEKNDNEFLPDNKKNWTERRYNDKLSNIHKVIVAVGEGQMPEIIGLCEIENRFVVEEIINKTPLVKYGYDIVHHESPDKRGIDVAFLYLKDKFKPLYDRAIPVVYPESSRPTRDVLYVKGILDNQDTLHVFVNHWSSRWGGQKETEPKRMFVASIVKNYTDSILNTNSLANIIIMGDLNDEPNNKSITDVLKAKSKYDSIDIKSLYNLSHYLQFEKHLGSHKYRENWGVLDQMIISGGMLSKQSKLYTTVKDAHIFKQDFLLEKDEKYLGEKTYRTYIGYKYNGGFSDHLPVYLDIYKSK